MSFNLYFNLGKQLWQIYYKITYLLRRVVFSLEDVKKNQQELLEMLSLV